VFKFITKREGGREKGALPREETGQAGALEEPNIKYNNATRPTRAFDRESASVEKRKRKEKM
jgi:hypothetical protein